MKTISILALSISPAVVVMGKPDFASRAVVSLEEKYIQDCETDSSPHGFYGAFLEPCEFAFFQGELETTDPCSGEPMATPMPLQWRPFNFTDHFIAFQDWDKQLSSKDDIPDKKNNSLFQDWDMVASKNISDPKNDSLLWPDQCVGVTPRCYSIADHALLLSRLFPDGGIPQEATHVRVDCRTDALAISRTIHELADCFETTTTMILWSASLLALILWPITFLVLIVCSTIWCFYLCFRLCRGNGRGRDQNVPQNARYVIPPQDIKGNYQAAHVD